MVSANYLSLLFLASTTLAIPALNKRCGESIQPPGVSWSFPNCFGACASDPACTGGQSQPAAPAAPAAPSAPSAPAPPQPAQPEAKTQTGGGANADVDLVNQYRQKMGKGSLSFNGQLQTNIQNTLNAHPGQMVHMIGDADGRPGTNAQVLAQGDCNDFKTALVQGWICEIPSLLQGECGGSSYTYNGQTGHAQILSDASYKTVACACSQGIWGCDFGL